MMQGDHVEGVVVRGRVVIDTRKPFGSVKEAVALFGERIHAGEVNKLKEIYAKGNDGENQNPKQGGVASELKETRQSLTKAKEEEKLMALCLDSLRQELEQTKKELYQLKAKENALKDLDKPEIEDIKFVEKNTESEKLIKSPNDNNKSNSFEDHSEFHRKRSVKFASPPLLTKVITSEDDYRNNDEAGQKMQPLVSKKKTKKKPLVPLFVGGLFSKKGSKDRTAKS